MTKPTSSQDDVIARQRLAELTARYGERWNDAELALIRERLRRSVRLGDALRAVPMTNADEPGNIFKPYRGAEEGR